MINIVCVLRSGGVYTPEYVYRLRESIDRHLWMDHRFTVLSDLPRGEFNLVSTVKQRCVHKALTQNWPGWWSKIELFRPDIFVDESPVWYFDLDTIIKADITTVASYFLTYPYDRWFFSLDDWLEPSRSMNSSVMCWNRDFSLLYKEFSKDPQSYMKQFGSWPDAWGDQGFIGLGLRTLFLTPYISIQRRFPGEFVSFKCSTEKERASASVVCFHGFPKPHQRNWDWR